MRISQLVAMVNGEVQFKEIHSWLKVEIELRRCEYSARCKRWWCRTQATVIAQYLDGLGQSLRQRELCEFHAGDQERRDRVRDMR
jgi:hypothetical protein